MTRRRGIGVVLGLLAAVASFQGAQARGSARTAEAASSAAAATRTAGTLTFLESSAALGVTESSGGLWGLAVADWNGDGCDDLYVGRHKSAPRLYRNGCPGRFTNDVARLRLDLLDPMRTRDRHSVAFGDYDGDGRLDLFVTTGAHAGTGEGDDQLFHQLPDGNFEDVASAAGITDPEGSGRFGLWFDYDLDGALDLFVGHELRESRPLQNRNILWRNLGGSFTNTAPQVGVAVEETSRSGVATDLDSDGDLDLITVPGTATSVYLRQSDGTFVHGSLNQPASHSIAPADYDNDGDVDLFLSFFRGHLTKLLRNDIGGASWTDVTAHAGLGFIQGAAGLWLDADSDGLLDLYLVLRARRGQPKPPNRLLMNQGDGTFMDVAASAGVTGPTDTKTVKGNTAVWGDFDEDGRVDLVLATETSATPVQLYLNRSETGNGWITLHLLDTVSGNMQAIGAEVWVTTGAETQYREIVAPTALQSQSPPYLIVGLGSSAKVDTLKIRWPDGTVSIFTDVPANSHYTATKDGLSPDARLQGSSARRTG